MAEMLSLSAASRERFRKGQVGSTRSVLWEKSSGNGGVWTGLTDNYLRVKASSHLRLSNEITGVRLTGVDEDWVLAEIEA